MRFSYKVWHSEKDKWAEKKEAGRALDDDEISFAHERLHEIISLNYQVEADIRASVTVLRPSLWGVVIVLDSRLGEDEADRSLARCLVRVNNLDPDLCLVAEPLPKTRQDARASIRSQLDMLSTSSSEL